MYSVMLLSSIMYMHSAHAQSTEKIYADPAIKHVATISLGLGTTGVGAEGKLSLNKHFNVRLGVSTLPLSYSGPLTLDGVKTTAKASGNFSKVSLLAEYKPFNSSIRLVGGLGYYFSAKPHVVLKPTQNYKFGQTTVTKDELGQMDITTNWNGIAPYLGIGLLPDFPKRKFNVNIDLGVYYLSKERSTFTGTNLLQDNSSNDAVLDNNLSGYRWMPELKINLTYKLN